MSRQHLWTAKKGLIAEERAIAIARLVNNFKGGELIKKHKVRRAPKWLDKLGIDFTISHFNFSNELIRTPFQVKSSAVGVTKYFEKYPLYAEVGVPVIIVNNERTDTEIALEIIDVLWDVLSKNKKFEWLYAYLKEKKQKVIETRVLGHRQIGESRKRAYRMYVRKAALEEVG